MSWTVTLIIVLIFLTILGFSLKKEIGLFLCKVLHIHTWKEVKIIGPSGTVVTKKICYYCGKEKK